MPRLRDILILVALGATACSGGPAAGRPGASSSAVPSRPVRTDVAPLPMLGPVADRWSYLPQPVPVDGAVPAPDPAAERTELENRRALVAARPVLPSDDRYTRVGEATPTRFMELVVDVGRRRSLNPLRMARAQALVAVAAHEASVAAARADVPAARTPRQVDPDLAAALPAVDGYGVEQPATGLPPELVAATAQQTVACAQFPPECPRFTRLGDVATDRALASGRYWPSTLDAAAALGRQVGATVSQYASTDGAASWTPRAGDLPAGGSWVPTPGMFAPPLEPFAGTWRPWNLTSGDQLRPPPPPQPGTPAFTAAVQQVLDVGTNVSDRDLRIVRYWDLGPGSSTPPGYWASDVAADALRTTTVADQAAALALTTTAALDAGIATWDAKYRYLLVRPVTAIRSGASPQWLPSLTTPPFPAYASGHAAFGTASVVVLSALLPARAEEFYDAAAEAGDSRVTGGIHYWFDDVEGTRIGDRAAVAALARAELAPDPALEPVEERLRFTSAEARGRRR
ncbi:MAG: phosphatase PAP2 family protein [Actinomycetes bacterium]